MEARGINASEGDLTALARGEVETEDGVLVLRRIHVRFTVRNFQPAQAEAARRAHDVFPPYCPVYRSIHRAITITTDIELAPAATAERGP
ncbi:MAG: OsmC family protein [Gemmatimonadales bacterium]